MFMPTSVARMPSIRPAEPVITPADRSNSPPIISSATTTAGMPIVDATSVQFAMPSSFRNREFCVQKKIATTTAASSAPISGRRSSRAAGLIFARRSSPAGTGGGGATSAGGAVRGGAAVAGSFIVSLPRVLRDGGRRPRGRPALRVPSSARAGLGQLLDRGDVVLLHEPGAREHRLAAADRVRVVAEQLQEHDRQVALQVLLLVDREQDVAGGDVLEDRRAEVERRELRARARALDRGLRRGGDVRVQRDDAVEGLVRLQLGLDRRLRRRDVGGALDLEVGDRAAEALLDAVAALLQADVVLLVDDAEDLLDAGRLELRARRLAGDRLGLTDVGDRAQRLGVLRARVQRDDRDAGRLGLRERVLDRARVRHRHREAVDLLRNGGVDQLRLLLRVVVRRAPDELDALVLRGLLGALLDDGPERALVAVGDHGDREPGALGQRDVGRGRGPRGRAAAGGLRVAVRVLVVVAAAPDRDQRDEREDGDEQPAGRSLHQWDTLSLLGARVDRYSMLLRTSSAGPAPAGGSVPVIAWSCSSTSQRSYPTASRSRMTSSIRASPSPKGWNSPSCVAATSDSSPSRTFAASAASTSLRWT